MLIDSDHVPVGAAWFTLHRWEGDGYKRATRDWFPADGPPPSEVAPTYGDGIYRALWRDPTKRVNRGCGNSWEVTDEADDPEPEATYVEENQPRPEREPAPAPAAPPRAAPAEGQRTTIAPALPPNASPELATHIYLHSLVRQDTLILQQQMMGFAQMSIESERARSESAIAQAREHYGSMLQASAAVQQAIVQLHAQAPSMPVELAAALDAQRVELAHLSARLNEEDDDDRSEVGRLLAEFQEAKGADKEQDLLAGLQQLLGVGFSMWEQFQKARGGPPIELGAAGVDSGE